MSMCSKFECENDIEEMMIREFDGKLWYSLRLMACRLHYKQTKLKKLLTEFQLSDFNEKLYVEIGTQLLVSELGFRRLKGYLNESEKMRNAFDSMEAEMKEYKKNFNSNVKETLVETDDNTFTTVYSHPYNGDIRMIILDENIPYLLAKDVCKVLKFEGTKNPLAQYVPNRCKKSIMIDNGKNEKIHLINEEGFVALVAASKKFDAEAIKRQVLKTINEYVPCDTDETPINEEPKEQETSTFSHQDFGTVRTLCINGEPWFVGKDVASALGYKDTADAIKKHVNADDKLTRRFADSGQNREMYIINESGLYTLIFGSKLESAQKFKKWVTSEVLPSIRKKGGYIKPGTEMKFLTSAFPNATEDEKKMLFDLVKRENEKIINANTALMAVNEKLTTALDEAQPKVDFYNAVAEFYDGITVAKFAALLSNQYNVLITQQSLFRFLRNYKYLCSVSHIYNKPSQVMIRKKYMTYKEYTAYVKHGRYHEKVVTCTPYITGAGQIFLTPIIMEAYNEGLIK